MNLKHSCSQINLTDPRYDEWKQHFVMGLATEAPDVPDDVLYDGQVAAHAVATLQRLKDQPFFMAVGFIKPHIPSVAPKRYWDLYDPSQLKLADNPFPPRGAPVWALREGQDYIYYYDFPKNGVPVDDALARQLIHGYCRSVGSDGTRPSPRASRKNSSDSASKALIASKSLLPMHRRPIMLSPLSPCEISGLPPPSSLTRSSRRFNCVACSNAPANTRPECEMSTSCVPTI